MTPAWPDGRERIDCAAMEPAPWERDDRQGVTGQLGEQGDAAMEPAPWERDDPVNTVSRPQLSARRNGARSLGAG